MIHPQTAFRGIILDQPHKKLLVFVKVQALRKIAESEVEDKLESLCMIGGVREHKIFGNITIVPRSVLSW